MSRSGTRHRRSRLRTMLAVAVLAAGGVLPAAAHAHVSLVESSPAQGAQLEHAPNEVRLGFSRRVTVRPGAVGVTAPNGDRRPVDVAVDDRVVVIPIAGDRTGTYVVDWSVVSADGHAIAGQLSFVIGDETMDGGPIPEPRRHTSGSGLIIAFGVAHFVVLLAVLIVSGGGIFSALLVPSWAPRFLGVAAVTAVVAALLAFVIDVANTAAVNVAEVLRPQLLWSELGSSYGHATTARIIMLLVVSGAIWAQTWQRRRAPHRNGAAAPIPSLAARLPVAVSCVVLAATLSLSGHSVASDPVWVRLPADMLHVLCAAVWLGGLFQLVLLGRDPHAVHALRYIDRYSRVTFAAVFLLVVTGAWAAYIEVGLASEAWLSSTYGRLLITKLVLLAGIVPLAFMNSRMHLPGLQSRPADARAQLTSYAQSEVLIVVAIVAITAWLIHTPPPAARHAVSGAEHAAVSGAAAQRAQMVSQAASHR